MNLHDFNDIHTHVADSDFAAGRSVLNLAPDGEPDERGWYSVGVHPWEADRLEELWPDIERRAAHSHVLAIGECGLDALRGPDMGIQQQAFERQVALSERLQKPLIIHAVRTWPQLIALRRRIKPRQEWIIHGFRGNATLAAELLRHSFSLSFGQRFNQEAYDITPPEKRYRESDTTLS